MKKILLIILGLLAFFTRTNTINAKTNTIELGNAIPNIRVHLKTQDSEENKNIYKIWNRNTGELVYSINPNMILENGTYTEYSDREFFSLEISKEDWDTITLLAYYGYLYQDRTDIKWYVITQMMIWEYLLHDTGEIYFIDNNNEKISLYEEEKETILEDIKKRDEIPSFAKTIYDGKSDYTIKLKEELILEDKNNILSKFAVNSNNNYVVPVVRDNKMTLIASYPVSGDIIISFRETPNTTKFPKLFYNVSSSSAVMSRGLIKMPSSFTQIKVLYPSFKLKLVDKNTDEPISNAKYGIFYDTGDLYDEVITNSLGEIYLEEIFFGNYYIKEIEAPYGYKLNDEKIYFEVKEEDIDILIEKEKIQKQVNFEKYLETKTGDLIVEKNVSFNLYNAEKELIKKVTTNELGKMKLILPFGTYYLSEVNGTRGFSNITDFAFVVGETEFENPIILKSNQIVGSLEIKKYDNLTKEPIFNVELGLYDENLNLLMKSFTDIDGKILFNNLDIGTYFIKELKTLEDYELLTEEIKIEITDSTKQILNIAGKLKENELENENKLEHENELEIEEEQILENQIIEDNSLKEEKEQTKIADNLIKIEVPKTGTNEFLWIGITYFLFIILGTFLIVYEKET